MPRITPAFFGGAPARRFVTPQLAAAITCLALLTLAVSSAHAISTRAFLSVSGAAVADALGPVASAGDVNGDGYADIIVGAPLNDAAGATAGRAYIYFGGPHADNIPDVTLTGLAAGDEFGISVAGAGDVNGDGYADVIVGAAFNDAVALNAGRAYVFFGGPNMNNVADVTVSGVAANDEFGWTVAAAGDVNGDGFADVIVGAPFNDSGGVDAGRAYVYFGGLLPNNVVDVTLTGAAAADQFGQSVSSAGDMNGDGYSDVIVGAPLNDVTGVNAGEALVFFGGLNMNNVADLTLAGAAASDQFGFTVAGAGDMNGDSYGDVIVGAPQSGAGGAFAGRAYVYFGGTSPNTVADLTLTGTAGDQLGNAVASAGDVNGDGFADVIVGAVNAVSGAGQASVYFGAATPNSVADITLTGEAGGDQFGTYVAAAGDVDGDGFPDVLVGAPYNDGAAADAGRAYVTTIFPYQVVSPNGGERWIAGQPATVRWRGHDAADIAVSLDGGATFSTVASGVGGLADNEYTVTAPPGISATAIVRLSQTGLTLRHSTSDASDRVFAIVPPAAPVAQRLARTLLGAAGADAFGYAMADAGDVNGDGFDDLIVCAPFNDAGGANAGRAYVYFGGPASDAVPDLTLTGAAANDEFGLSVAGAGDVNGDGYADVIVGAPLNDTGGASIGQAYVYFGGASPNNVADLTLTGLAPNSEFGYSVGAAGDVNGDGFADFIVGAPLGAGASAGQALIYFGGRTPDNVADVTFTGALANDQLGTSVAGAGDVNGDGFADVIVGAPLNDASGNNAGAAYVYFGGSNPDNVADVTLTGQAPADEFGLSVARAGDVNGDGLADVIVGAPFNDTGGSNAGRAYVYLGGSPPGTVPAVTMTGSAAGDELGYTVASAGDVNGDGFADLILGAFLNGHGGPSAGQAYVYFGGTVPSRTPDITVTGTTNDQLGYQMCGIGDANGDGFDDVAAAAVSSSLGAANAGAVFVYDSNRYFVTSPNSGGTWNVGSSQSVSWLGAAPADLWLSTDGGTSYSLLRSAVGGSESNSLTLRVPHSPTRFARIKLTPSDVAVHGADETDSLFTIQTSVSLLTLSAHLAPEGGALLNWSTDPGIGADGLAGYRVYRLDGGGIGTRIGPDLIAESRYLDAAGTAGSRYRVAAVNGLGEELSLGEVALAPAAPLAAWPRPYRGGAMQVSFATAGGLGGGAGSASVEMFDLSGRKVRTIANGQFRSGYQTTTWDGRDDAGREIGNGVYFLIARSGGESARIKLVVMR